MGLSNVSAMVRKVKVTNEIQELRTEEDSSIPLVHPFILRPCSKNSHLFLYTIFDVFTLELFAVYGTFDLKHPNKLHLKCIL